MPHCAQDVICCHTASWLEVTKQSKVPEAGLAETWMVLQDYHTAQAFAFVPVLVALPGL